MKRGSRFFLIIVLTAASAWPTQRVQAQDIAAVIKQAVVKVIKAVDLKIQRLQNNVIRLQNAQKAIENAMAKLKLEEISDWVEKQRKLYADYYDELWKVKALITYYKDVKAIIQKQKDLVEEYKRAYNLFKDDKHFTQEEINYMKDVYEGILDESLKNIDQIFLVVNAFKTQMTDGSRLQIIQQASDNIDQNLVDLRRFNNSNVLISFQRAKDQSEIARLRAWYGIE